jgi:hypothetical protein
MKNPDSSSDVCSRCRIQSDAPAVDVPRSVVLVLLKFCAIRFGAYSSHHVRYAPLAPALDLSVYRSIDL